VYQNKISFFHLVIQLPLCSHFAILTFWCERLEFPKRIHQNDISNNGKHLWIYI